MATLIPLHPLSVQEEMQLQQLARLRAWLEQKEHNAGKSAKAWAKAAGDQNPQATYRAGEWFAYRNVLNFLSGANYL